MFINTAVDVLLTMMIMTLAQRSRQLQPKLQPAFLLQCMEGNGYRAEQRMLEGRFAVALVPATLCAASSFQLLKIVARRYG